MANINFCVWPHRALDKNHGSFNFSHQVSFFVFFGHWAFLHFFTIYFMLDGLSGQEEEKTIKKIVLTIFPNSL